MAAADGWSLSLHKGTLFSWLFFVLAPVFGMLVSIRCVRRAIHEPQRRWPIVAAGLTALGMWGLASDVVLSVVFDTAWSVAHQRPLPSGWFPEGWLVYALLAAYTALGAGLVAGLARVPEPAAASRPLQPTNEAGPP
jgi:hypothetical protein